MTDQVNEKSTAYLVVDFVDKNGAAVAPSTLTYRVDCRSTGTVVRADTALTPAAEVEIELTPADTAILNSANASETRRVTLKATFGVGGAANKEIDFEVLNLSQVS